MIEKLEPLQGLDHSWLNKINELVDAVNVLQCKNVHIESNLQDLMYPKEIKCEPAENGESSKMEQDHRPNMVMDDPFGPHPNIYEQGRPADPYAEQRKWVGMLCCFWDNNIGEKVWGILGGIDYSENAKYPYWCDQLQEQYQCCEPVKPTDSIIYKGV